MAELIPQTTSIQTLYGWYREGKLNVNRRYQRKLVWTLLEKQKLIESILKKYPVPAILLAEQENQAGSYEIIDGLQRLQAVLSFIELAFPSIDNRYFDINNFPTAKTFADEGLFDILKNVDVIDPKENNSFLDYALSISVMRNAKNTEIDDVFDRINTYGHRLSDQERRQAGVKTKFSNVVRSISCTMRGDASEDIVSLYKMPGISIDLPKTRHGYSVKAEEVFWVEQGILRSTDLRDSLDEQCIADICSSIINGQITERSKEALDKIYSESSRECATTETALEVFGSDNLKSQFTFCIEEIIKICNSGSKEKLRDIVFLKRNTNGFPSLFSIILIAVYELLIQKNLKISNYVQVKEALKGCDDNVETGNKASSSRDRRKNVNIIKSIIEPSCVLNEINPRVFTDNTAPEIDAAIRRSEIELPNYELKQGLLLLDNTRSIDRGMVQKLINTVAAIINNGPNTHGKIILGVADDEKDAKRIASLDNVQYRVVNNKYVVGIKREAKRMNITLEEYVNIIKVGINQSELTEELKPNVLSNIDYNDYFGLGLIIINILPQKTMAFVGGKVFWRNIDSTEEVKDMKRVSVIAQRF